MGGTITCCIKAQTATVASTTYQPPPPQSVMMTPHVQQQQLQLQDFKWYNEIVSEKIKSTVVDEQKCVIFARMIGKGWQSLLLRLGMSQKDLELEIETFKGNTYLIIYRGLLIWFQKYCRNATVNVLMNALQEGNPTITVDMDQLKAYIEIELPSQI